MSEELLKAYIKRFGEGFPTMMVARGRTEQEVDDIINECLAKGKDAYELGYAEDDDNIY